MVLRNDVSMNAEGPEQESGDLLGYSPHSLPQGMRKHPLPQQHHLHLQQQQQQQQADTSSNNKCLLTSAVQLMDGVHSNGAPRHLRSKWNRIRERLGRIQTAGAENKQRRASQVLGAPSLALGSRSNSTTPTASTTPSHGQLSVPLPQPSESKAPSKPSLSCIGSLRQQPCDPSVVCQLSRRSSSRPATIDAPLPFLPHSRSNSSSTATAALRPQVEPVMELEDWPGAAQLPASAFFDTSLGQEQGLPAETCVEQRPFSLLPVQAQASTLCRPSKHSTHPVVPRALETARSCPLPVAAPPAAATPPTAALSSAAATPSAALSITAPAAAVPSAAGTAAGAAAAAKPPTAPAACMGGLGGGGGVLMAHLPLHSGSWGAGQHRLTTEPRLSRLARSHTFTDMSPLDKSAGSNDGNDDDGAEVYSAPVFDATAASPEATPPTVRALSKPEQQVPLPLQPHPPCMHPKQPLHMPPNVLQQTPRAPLPLPPCSPPPEDHLFHRVRHRSRSHTQISPSMLQQHALASAVPAVVPGRHTTDATPCIQPPPSSTASAPLAPTSRATSHHHSFVRTASACSSDTQDAIVSTPQLSHQNAAASPHTPVHMGRSSLDHAHPRPPLSPRSPPTPQPATATHAHLLAHLHQSAPNLLLQQTHAAVAPGGDNGERGGAARNHRRSISLLLRGSSRMEQELKWGAESQKPARGKAGLSRTPATPPSDAPPAAAAAAVAAAAAASGTLSTMPAMKGAKTEKQPMRTVASACQLSDPAFAVGTPPASHRWGAGAASNSTTEQVPARAASNSGAISTTPSSLSCALSGSSVPSHLSRNSSNTTTSSSSRSPFRLHSGARSSSGKVAAPVCDSCCEMCSFSSSSCGKCGADMSAAKARLLSSIPSHLSRCSSSAGATTPSTLSCVLSSSVPSHLSRCSSNATNTSSASNSVKEPPAVAAAAAAAAAALEHAGPLHSLPLADVAEGTRTTVMEPSHSVLASVPEAELEVAEGNGVAGLEGAAAAAPAAAAGGPDGAQRQLEQQQQQQSNNETAGGQFRAKLLASLRAVGSMGKNAH